MQPVRSGSPGLVPESQTGLERMIGTAYAPRPRHHRPGEKGRHQRDRLLPPADSAGRSRVRHAGRRTAPDAKAAGYVATLVSGVPILRNDGPTGERPRRLLRSRQRTSRKPAAVQRRTAEPSVRPCSSSLAGYSAQHRVERHVALVVTRQRANSPVIPNSATVNISSSPSRAVAEQKRLVGEHDRSEKNGGLGSSWMRYFD